MQRVLIVFPTQWDLKQLEACRAAWSERYELTFTEPSDDEWPWDFDVLGFIDRAVERYRGAIDGVLSASDYPGAPVAAAIATALGLPGPTPQSVLRCGHKLDSRVAQRETAPAATPRFCRLDPRDPVGSLAIGFPCFVKPVKGAFSILSGRVDSAEQLRAFLARPAAREFGRQFVHMFSQLLRRYTDSDLEGGVFMAEELLQGRQVTVEGFSRGGAVEILGVVDSVLHPERGSFVRFDYPSRLAAGVQSRMAEIAGRVIRQVGLGDALFNIELMFDAERDRISIIEVNPRLCGQFGDLYQKVDGVSNYEVALALATGSEPRRSHRRGDCRVACSWPLRIFEPTRVVRAPPPQQVEAVEREFPGTLIWKECRSDLDLTDFERMEDGASVRYGVINAGAEDHEALQAKLDQIYARLGFELVPLTSPMPDP